MASSSLIQIKEILAEAVKKRAGSVHFSVGSVPMVRIGGELILLDDYDVVTVDLIDGLISHVLDDVRQKKLANDKEIVTTFEFDKNARFKVNVFYQQGTVSVTMHYIPAQVPSIDSLGLGQVVNDLATLDKGLVIISGAFGSGRSTTIAALVDEINRSRKEYIITVEDPIEHIFSNKKSIIEQREVGRDTKSFLDALKYFQEEDGDVLFLEEMHDTRLIPEVLEIARGSALVFTAISAGSVTQTVSRILDSFQSFDQERIRDLLSTSLRAIVCQKLLPKFGGGLIPVHEVLIVNEAVRSVISSGNLKQLDTVIQTSRADKMISFDQSIVGLFKSGKISREDALNNASDKNKLTSLLK
jgi:twitching motility protein PilT